MELISVHIPKTAGVSFRQLLQHIYGEEGVAFDYADRILDPAALYHTDRADWRRTQRASLIARLEANPGSRVIHGHFAGTKYVDQFPGARRLVWVREPVARLISHYHYWRGLPHGGHSLHRRLLEENLSLVEFAALEPMRDAMSRLFLDGASLSDYDFVGRQECFDEDVAHLARLLGWDPAVLPAFSPLENRNDFSGAKLAQLDGETRRHLQDLNPADTALYREACELAAARGSKP